MLAHSSAAHILVHTTTRSGCTSVWFQYGRISAQFTSNQMITTATETSTTDNNSKNTTTAEGKICPIDRNVQQWAQIIGSDLGALFVYSLFIYFYTSFWMLCVFFFLLLIHLLLCHNYPLSVGKLVSKIFNKRWPIDQPRHCSTHHSRDDRYSCSYTSISSRSPLPFAGCPQKQKKNTLGNQFDLLIKLRMFKM